MTEVKTAVIARAETAETAVSVKPISWVAAILVRTARVYLQSLSGFLLAALGVSSVDLSPIMPADFAGQFLVAAQLAVAPTVITFLQNTLEVLGRIDRRLPQWRA